MKFTRIIVILGAALSLHACGGGSESGSPPETQPPPTPTISVDVGVKQLIFSWPIRADVRWDASYYRLLENPDGHSGFTQVGDDIPAEMGSVRRNIAVHLFDFANALYILEACNNYLCSRSTEINVMNGMLDAVGYFKASNTGTGDFLSPVALSDDGATLAVGATGEDSCATGVGGDQDDNSCINSGAVYVFRNDGTRWSQESYVKASNSGAGDVFGKAIALSADGNTLAVGAPGESSMARIISGDQSDNTAIHSGAVYLFKHDGSGWQQVAYIKASNADAEDNFGSSIALSINGSALVVGATSEASSASGINGDQADNSSEGRGAVYVFQSTGSDWYQQAYVKDPLARGDCRDITYRGFGVVVEMFADDAGLVVGELCGFSGYDFGAAHVFDFDGTNWVWRASAGDSSHEGTGHGSYVSISEDGNTLAVGAPIVWAPVSFPGSAFVYRFDGQSYELQTSFQASNKDLNVSYGEMDQFGNVALSADGKFLAIAAAREFGGAVGVNGDQYAPTRVDAGSVYVFGFDGISWTQRAYVKASNTDERDLFGSDLALSADGSTLAVTGSLEDSATIGIDGDQTDNSAENSGALYIY